MVIHNSRPDPFIAYQGAVMAIITAIEGLPKLHVTPLTSVICNAPKIIVEADDEKE